MKRRQLGRFIGCALPVAALSGCSGGSAPGAAGSASAEVSCPACGVTTLAGSAAGFADGQGAAAQFDAPQGLAVDAQNNVYVADTDNYRVRKVTAQGEVTTLAGGARGFADGSGTAALFRSPYAVAVDAAGNIYVADGGNHRIRKLDATGNVTTLAGGTAGFADGEGAAAQFNVPVAVAVDAQGSVYVADANNQRIRKVTAAGTVTTLAGGGAGDQFGIVPGAFADGAAADARFSGPGGLALDAAGNVYVADSFNHRIRKLTPGGQVSTLAGSSETSAPGQEGAFRDAQGADARFNVPRGLAFGDGNVYVADSGTHRIRRVTAAGFATTLAGGGPVGINNGDYADGPGPNARFKNPQGVALGPDGAIYIADTFNNRIRVLRQPAAVRR